MRQTSIKQAFWDYNFTERQLLQKLSKGTKEEKTWIIGRMLENLPYNCIWKYITPEQVKDFFPYLHLRSKLKQIWSYTLSLWDKYYEFRTFVIPCLTECVSFGQRNPYK